MSDLPAELEALGERELLQCLQGLFRGAVSEKEKLEIAKIAGIEVDERELYFSSEAEAAAEDQYRDQGVIDLNETADILREEDCAMVERAKYVPLRLSYEERKYLRLLESALHVSEYVERVDTRLAPPGVSLPEKRLNIAKQRKLAMQVRQMCAILTALVVAKDYQEGKELIETRDFKKFELFYRSVFEIGRRYKILNPERMRDSYGKILYFLQDTVRPDIGDLLGFSSVLPVKTVYDKLKDKKNGLRLLEDPLCEIACQEIMPDNKPRHVVQKEIKEKEKAIKDLGVKYAQVKRKQKYRGGFFSYSLAGYSSDEDMEEASKAGKLTQEEIENCLHSLGDHSNYLRFNCEPCERMLKYLDFYFRQGSDELNGETNGTITSASMVEYNVTLAIAEGRDGSRLSHSHTRQYQFVRQSLMLWREVIRDMFKLWHLAEDDLLDSDTSYRLEDTGQGMHRVQASPRVAAAMKQIVSRVQREAKGWIGSSIIHLGDHNVPNALMFIDKYTQVPRILNPILLTLEKMETMVDESCGLRDVINGFGGVHSLRKIILSDFFRHAFDGSGADNFFDAGSCIDGRLTSAWNWCSQIEGKDYFPVFQLTGFTGFDGQEGF